MFVVKDPDLFAATIIPQYFDHNKFSSFARQLNFYGFRKMQAKPIRNADFDVDTAKHVTFYNEKFKRGRCDLLKEIQRSTRGGGSNSNQDHQREIENLKKQVSTLETKLTEATTQMEDRMRRLELDMLGRMEQMMIAMQQSQQTQLQLHQQQQQVPNGNNGTNPVNNNNTANNSNSNGNSGNDEMQTTRPEQGAAAWDPLPLERKAGAPGSFNPAPPIVSTDSTQPPKVNPPPTLPPHPKQKQLPLQGLPGALTLPPSRLNSLRGISRGVSRGVSVESSASAILLRNSWEDKFFSMLMLGENEQQQHQQQQHQQQQQQQVDGDIANGPISDVAMEAMVAAAAANGGTVPGVVKSTTHDQNGHHHLAQPHLPTQGSDRTLSSVSTTEAI